MCRRILFLVVLSVAVAVIDAITIGRCPTELPQTVDGSPENWEGDFYGIVISNNPGVSCDYHFRSFNRTEDPTKPDVIEYYAYKENGVDVQNNFLITRLGKGHYKFTLKIEDKSYEIQSFMLHNEKHFECHYSCSDNDIFKGGKPALWCVSSYPDPKPEYACKIKEVAASVGIAIKDLNIVNNCGCDMPYHNGPSQRETISREDYFAKC